MGHAGFGSSFPTQSRGRWRLDTAATTGWGDFERKDEAGQDPTWGSYVSLRESDRREMGSRRARLLAPLLWRGRGAG